MKSASFPQQAGISRLSLFLALSRTPHLLLDLASPGLAALLCTRAFPPLDVLALGLITAFSGYTAVYSLNDLIDYRVDRETTITAGTSSAPKADLDSMLVRHPLAQGMLSFREGLSWTVSWACLALIGAFFLNPVCLTIFLAACLLEVAYCFLLKVTYLRSIISGIVKTSGPMAAVFAVNPSPSLPYVAVIFIWLFFWEIGGQNVPNDLSDLDTDLEIKARTIPVRFGTDGSIMIILSSLVIALFMSLAVFRFTPKPLSPLYLLGALAAGFYFLMLPGLNLFRRRSPEDAFRLFNRASYYPLSMLAITMLSWAIA